MEVQTLNKDPVVIGRQKVHEQGDDHLAANLHTNSGQREHMESITILMKYFSIFLFLVTAAPQYSH